MRSNKDLVFICKASDRFFRAADLGAPTGLVLPSEREDCRRVRSPEADDAGAGGKKRSDKICIEN